MSGASRKIHFVGVGGIGMSGLAEILINLGHEVSGSDLQASEIVERLEQLGLSFHEGHSAAQLGDAEIVVVSAAVPQDNVEVAAAKAAGIPVLHRSEVLADVIRLKPNAVVVGGSHGKTTTTSMISAILDRADIGATSVVGGILHRSGTNARWGTGDYIVAEADEHDGSFLRLHPTVGVVTNIDAEHLDYYGTLDRIKRAFVDFCNGVPFYGYSILCADDANSREIMDEIESVCITYGLDEGASVRGREVRLDGGSMNGSLSARLRELHTKVEVSCTDRRLDAKGDLGSLEIHALGHDNVRNALAACTVGLCLGIPFSVIRDGLRDYGGVQRRMQVRGEVRGTVVIEDYAHHPTEIRSTLNALRTVNPARIVCVFQPHLYSRTQYFYEQFAEALMEADRAIVTDIYGSREAPMPGVHSELIVDAARKRGGASVELVDDMTDVAAALAGTLGPDDAVLVLGAGDINRIVPSILEALAQG